MGSAAVLVLLLAAATCPLWRAPAASRSPATLSLLAANRRAPCPMVFVSAAAQATNTSEYWQRSVETVPLAVEDSAAVVGYVSSLLLVPVNPAAPFVAGAAGVLFDLAACRSDADPPFWRHPTRVRLGGDTEPRYLRSLLGAAVMNFAVAVAAAVIHLLLVEASLWVFTPHPEIPARRAAAHSRFLSGAVGGALGLLYFPDSVVAGLLVAREGSDAAFRVIGVVAVVVWVVFVPLLLFAVVAVFASVSFYAPTARPPRPMADEGLDVAVLVPPSARPGTEEEPEEGCRAFWVAGRGKWARAKGVPRHVLLLLNVAHGPTPRSFLVPVLSLFVLGCAVSSGLRPTARSATADPRSDCQHEATAVAAITGAVALLALPLAPYRTLFELAWSTVAYLVIAAGAALVALRASVWDDVSEEAAGVLPCVVCGLLLVRLVTEVALRCCCFGARPEAVRAVRRHTLFAQHRRTSGGRDMAELLPPLGPQQASGTQWGQPPPILLRDPNQDPKAQAQGTDGAGRPPPLEVRSSSVASPSGKGLRSPRAVGFVEGGQPNERNGVLSPLSLPPVDLPPPGAAPRDPFEGVAPSTGANRGVEAQRLSGGSQEMEESFGIGKFRKNFVAFPPSKSGSLLLTPPGTFHSFSFNGLHSPTPQATPRGTPRAQEAKPQDARTAEFYDKYRQSRLESLLNTQDVEFRPPAALEPRSDAADLPPPLAPDAPGDGGDGQGSQAREGTQSVENPMLTSGFFSPTQRSASVVAAAAVEQPPRWTQLPAANIVRGLWSGSDHFVSSDSSVSDGKEGREARPRRKSKSSRRRLQSPPPASPATTPGPKAARPPGRLPPKKSPARPVQPPPAPPATDRETRARKMLEIL